MYAIVKDAAITATGTIKQLFPNTSFAGGVANEEFKKAENVEDVINAEQKDRTYYYVTQGNIVLVDGVPTQQFTNTAKQLNDRDATDEDGNKVKDADGNQLIEYGLKTAMTNQVKTTANSLLATTDWMIIRKVERSVNVPSATETYRAAVITECARLETAIGNASDVDALATVMSEQNWPTEG